MDAIHLNLWGDTAKKKRKAYIKALAGNVERSIWTNELELAMKEDMKADLQRFVAELQEKVDDPDMKWEAGKTKAKTIEEIRFNEKRIKGFDDQLDGLAMRIDSEKRKLSFVRKYIANL